MDGTKPRNSDAAATRKRRSSILKSQRSARAPLSELEFNVTTPPDQAKSRRVSFSRRTGVAEFEINEATTAWKNVYEEHNKSLESSANESGMKAAPARVAHLGARAHFSDDEAEEVDSCDPPPPPPPPPPAELAPSHNTVQLFPPSGLHTRGGLTEELRVDFSEVAPLADDLEQLQQDLERPCTGNMSEYSIDVDFNATHFTLKADDDMSITDTIRSPTMSSGKIEPKPDWTADKENIVVNPYIAPPASDNFAIEDDILVFDGKKCKFQSNLDVSDDADMSVSAPVVPVMLPTRGNINMQRTVLCDADMTVTGAISPQISTEEILAMHDARRRLVVFNNDGDISVTRAVPTNIIAGNNETKQTMYFDDMGDMSVTQALPADIIQEPKGKTIVFDDRHLSMTEAVSGVLLTEQREKPEVTKHRTIVTGVVLTDIHEAKVNIHTDRRRTIVYGNEGNISMTGVVPGNILEEVKTTGLLNTDRRKTIVYGNDDGNMSVTGAVPVNIFDQAKVVPSNPEQRKTIVFRNENGNVSMTGNLLANILDQNGANVNQQNTNRRRTVVYGNEDGNVSMTGVVPANILEKTKVTSLPNTDRRRTVVYGNEDGNVSMTGVIPANILERTKVTSPPNIDRRKTVVYGNEDGNVSMTGVMPANILERTKVTSPPNTDRIRTVVYGNEDGNVSMTGVIPANILERTKVTSPPNTDRRKTVVYGNEDGNVSMTGVIPANILERTKVTSPPNTDRRRTVVYGNEDGNVSMTGVVPVNILTDDRFQLGQLPTTDRRKTIVYGNDDGNVSMTGVVPPNTLDETRDPQPPNAERRKTIVYGNDDGNVSMTGVVPANILDEARDPQFPNAERRKTIVYGNDDGNVSMTGVVPANILDESRDTQLPNAERRKTIVYGKDDGNVSMTGVVPGNIIDEAKNQPPNTERRKTIVHGNDDGNLSITGTVPVNIQGRDATTVNQSVADHRTLVYGSDGNVSMADLLPANILEEANIAQPQNTGRRKTIVYGNDDGNLSITGVVPGDICDQGTKVDQSTTERRKTVGFANDDRNMSVTGMLPANILHESINQALNANTRRSLANQSHGNGSTAGVLPVNIPGDANVTQSPSISRRKSIDNDNDESMTETVPAQIPTETVSEVMILGTPSGRKEVTQNEAYKDREESVMSKLLKSDNRVSMSQSLVKDLYSQSAYRSMANNVLVYGAAMDRTMEHKSKESDEVSGSPSPMSAKSPNASIGAVSISISPRCSLQERNKSPDRKSIEEAKPQVTSAIDRASLLDALLDMSQASADQLAIEYVPPSEPPPTTVAEGPSDTTLTNSIPTSESYIVVRDTDDDPFNKDESMDTEPPALDSSQPLALEYKKEKHGIVCKLQHKLSELKGLLHIKEKTSSKTSPTKDPKASLTINEGEKKLSIHTSKVHHEAYLELENQSQKINSILKTSLNLEEKAELEKSRSLMIDLTSRMSIHENSPEQEKKALMVSVTSAHDHEQEEKEERSSSPVCRVDDTRAILDALSDFTDTRRSGDFEPSSPDKTRRSSAPDRKSMVISREDLLREISMAQALMKTEMNQTEPELTEGSSDEQEASPPRLSSEVVKTLRFEDDDSILENHVLQKPSAVDPSPRRASTVIPAFDVSDHVKELVHDLIKPMADVAPQCLSDYKRAEDSRSSQVDNFVSSQIDLIPSGLALVEPRSCLRRTSESIQHSEPVDRSPSPRKISTAPAVLEFDHYNPLNNILLPPIDQTVVHKYNPRRSEESITPSLDSQAIQTEPSDHSRNVDCGMLLVSPKVDRGVANDRSMRDCSANTSIAMKGNRELLAASSSLTLVDDALARSGLDFTVGARSRSPVRVIFKLEEACSSVQLDSDMTSSGSAENKRQKRGHIPAKGAEVTPKPALKVKKLSSPRGRRRSPSPEQPPSPAPYTSPEASRSSSATVATVAALWSCARSTASSGADRTDWRPDLLHELSSKNLASEQDPGVNVVAKIDVLPFMGTSECEWESRATDTWSFRLLRSRLRLVVRLEHRACNTTRALVRADTPVKLVLVQHASLDCDDDPVAGLCLCLAAEALQRIAGRGVPLAGSVPALLRRCAAVARVALRWARAMRAARALLAFSLAPDGLLSLKVANIPLRSVWEVSLRVALMDAGRGAPWPRAGPARAARVVAAWAPADHELEALVRDVPEDWGHVPRTIWKIFKYLKNKRPEDDLLAA